MRKEQTDIQATGTETESGRGGFRVTYFDGHCGRIRVEEFNDLAQAERYAHCRLRDEDDWAIVDEISADAQRRAA